MTRALPRATFSSSKLVRLLASHGAGTTTSSPASKQDFAERLGQWLRVPDAIELHAALHGNTAQAATVAVDAAAISAVAAMAEEVTRTHQALASTIQRSFSADAGERRLTFPMPQAGSPADAADVSFVPFHRFHLAHQREMELRITPLRARLRAALNRGTPSLQALAALDAVFEKSLAAREYTLLVTVPTLLEHRFTQWLTESGPTNDASWLHRFRDEMQQALLAELDLRFEPITGLLAALQAAPVAAQPSPLGRKSATAHPINR